MKPRLHLAILAGKTTHLATRALRRGGGTAAPGLIAERINPNLLRQLTQSLPYGSVIISGTNGKTTTSRLLSFILQASGLRAIHNRSGSNLTRGLASTLVTTANLAGGLRADIGLFEVDEGALPTAALQIKPRVLILTNLFRDQLDRYFEVDQILLKWRQMLGKLPESTIVCLNADDPRLAQLGTYAKGPVVYFGIAESSHKLEKLPQAIDVMGCPDCNSQLAYEEVYLSHQGKYFCSSCHFRRPDLQVKASKIELKGLSGTSLELTTPNGKIHLEIGVPGFYNVYNGLAAAAGAAALGANLTAVERGIASFHAAFGRIERIPIGEKEILLTLVKNPTGFNEVLRMLGSTEHEYLLLALNDLLADGTDVSWIWDVELEKLADQKTPVTVSGIRAWDLANRLKYAGVNPSLIQVQGNITTALHQALDNTPPGKTLYILPTYTAMLELRQNLVKSGNVGEFWED